MKLPSIFKNKDMKHPVLQWPLCKQPKTLSFRAEADVIKTSNSLYFDPLDLNASGVTSQLKSCCTNSSSQFSYSCGDGGEAEESDESCLERIVCGARSERLFFEAGSGETSSILEVEAKAKAKGFESDSLLKGSVVLAMESEDPYLDFKSSMQEMVETHGLNDWESLEELLGWYLKINGKMNHGFIVGAFVDILLGLAFSFPSCCSEHHYSFLSASSSPSLSPSADR